MEFRVLGPLEVTAGGREVAIDRPQRRALLVLLVMHANHVVSMDRLVDALWGEAPPPGATATLQAHVSHLRKALAGGRESVAGPPIESRRPGYLLRVDPGSVDALRFERLSAEGRAARAAGRADAAAALLRDALGLWRGQALADVAFEPFAQPEIARLEELRLVTLEERVEADLALGRHVALVGELEAVVSRHPLRERLWGQLMLALYRSGRQAEALRAYQALRRTLADELGIEPSRALQQLEEAILLQDQELDRAGGAAPTGEAAAEASGTLEVWGPEGRELVALAGDRLTIGRSASCDLALAADARVSRLHAVVERLGGSWSIRDLNSRNGTFLNGEPAGTERPLRHGDEIRVGDTRIVFLAVSGEDPESLTEQAPPEPGPAGWGTSGTGEPEIHRS